MKTWLKQLFCKHRFRLNDPNEYFPHAEEVGCDMVSYVREHTCEKCGNTRMIGSGWMC